MSSDLHPDRSYQTQNCFHFSRFWFFFPFKIFNLGNVWTQTRLSSPCSCCHVHLGPSAQTLWKWPYFQFVSSVNPLSLKVKVMVSPIWHHRCLSQSPWGLLVEKKPNSRGHLSPETSSVKKGLKSSSCLVAWQIRCWDKGRRCYLIIQFTKTQSTFLVCLLGFFLFCFSSCWFRFSFLLSFVFETNSHVDQAGLPFFK